MAVPDIQSIRYCNEDPLSPFICVTVTRIDITWCGHLTTDQANLIRTSYYLQSGEFYFPAKNMLRSRKTQWTHHQVTARPATIPVPGPYSGEEKIKSFPGQAILDQQSNLQNCAKFVWASLQFLSAIK